MINAANVSTLMGFVNTDDYNEDNYRVGDVHTIKLSNALDKEPVIGFFILQKWGWKVDHSARNQINRIAADIKKTFSDELDRMATINNNSIIIAHNHRRFNKAFESNLPPYAYPFDRKKVEILAYTVSQFFDLASYEDYETGLKLITTVASADYRLQFQRNLLREEGYDVDVVYLVVADEETGSHYSHTWLYHKFRDSKILHNFLIKDMV